MVEFTFSENGKYLNLESVFPCIDAAPQPQAQPQSGYAVEDSESFATTICMIASEKNIGQVKLETILQAELGCGIDTVPAESQKAALELVKGL
jgi:hypothetical protein